MTLFRAKKLTLVEMLAKAGTSPIASPPQPIEADTMEFWQRTADEYTRLATLSRAREQVM